MARKRIEIIYCDDWQYTARAAWMALELLSHYRKELASMTLVPSGGGRFEVSVDGALVVSKLENGRFPEPKELKSLLDHWLQAP